MKKLCNYLKTHPVFTIWLGVIIAVIPAICFRDYTPANELRYLSIADEAIANGHVFTFCNQGVAYADKPPLYLWIVMLGKLLLGQHCMWFLALFSLIPALIIMTIMDRWVAEELSPKMRLSANLMMMTTGLFIGLALTLRMDMLMCMFITLALRTFYRIYTGHGRPKDSWLFPIYVFMAVFSKGPIGILVPLLSVIVFLAYKRQIRTLGRYWGWKTWVVLIPLCAIWFGAVFAEGGTEYLDNLLFNQTVNRAVDSFSHKRPFYYYLTAIWYSLAPWSIFAIGVIIAGFCKKGVKHSTLEQFLATVLVTTFLMLSIISSKIAVYLAPLFPVFIYLAMLELQHFGRNRWINASLILPMAILLLAFPAMLILGALRKNPVSSVFFYVCSAVLTLSAGYSIFTLCRQHNICRAVNTTAIGVLLAVFIAGWGIPSINDMIGYRNLCEKAKKEAAERHLSKFYVTGLSRPENMDVYLGTDVIPVEQADIDAGLCSDGVIISAEPK